MTSKVANKNDKPTFKKVKTKKLLGGGDPSSGKDLIDQAFFPIKWLNLNRLYRRFEDSKLNFEIIENRIKNDFQHTQNGT